MEDALPLSGPSAAGPAASGRSHARPRPAARAPAPGPSYRRSAGRDTRRKPPRQRRVLACAAGTLAAALLAVFATALAVAPAAAQTANATGKPAISGPPQVDETLTADTGAIADADGLGAFSYQWVRVNRNGRNATEIAGATASTYTPVAADVGKKVKVKVSFTDGAGNAEEVISEVWPRKGYPNARIVSAKTACPADSDWCAEMTVGYKFSTGGLPSHTYGFYPSSGGTGTLSDADVTHDGTTYTFAYIYISQSLLQNRRVERFYCLI